MEQAERRQPAGDRPSRTGDLVDPFLVEGKSDMLIRAWRLSRRHERLKRHDGIPLNRAGRTTYPPDPVAASRDTLFVVNRRARVIHRLAQTSEPEPPDALRLVLRGFPTDEVVATPPHTRRACTVCFRHVFSPTESEQSSSEDED